ncbi:multicopper oxidase domain-containing protein [Rhodococcus sp. NM-2]
MQWGWSRTPPVNWMVHCHNGHHQKPGMVTRLDYTG